MIEEFALNLNYGPEPDTVSFLIKQGARVAELQVTIDERLEGESYLKPLTACLLYTSCAAICRRELLRTPNGAGTSVLVFRNRQLEERCRAIAGLDVYKRQESPGRKP